MGGHDLGRQGAKKAGLYQGVETIDGKFLRQALKKNGRKTIEFRWDGGTEAYQGSLRWPGGRGGEVAESTADRAAAAAVYIVKKRILPLYAAVKEGAPGSKLKVRIVGGREGGFWVPFFVGGAVAEGLAGNAAC